MINLRNALMGGKRLPYDAEVEYLEGTGTQYINTGVTGGDGTLGEISVSRTWTSLNDCVFGAWDYGSKRLWFCYSNGNKWYPGYGNKAGTSNASSTSAGFTQIKSIISNGYFGYEIDGVEYLNTSKYGTGFVCPNPILIFAMGTESGANYFTKAKVAWCKITQNGVLVRDYIPVRVGTVGYLYDRVSGKLFGNAGTGDFVVGPDKN